jgi:hypothetical protein
MVLNSENKKLIPALIKNRWIMACIENTEKIYSIHSLSQAGNQLQNEKHILDFIFTQNGNTLILYYKTSVANSEQIVKDIIIKIFTNSKIVYKDYSLINLGAINSTPIAEIMLSGSSHIALDFLNDSENGSIDDPLGKSISMHLILADSFKISSDEMPYLYSFLLQQSLSSIALETETIKKEVSDSLVENFNSQREEFIGYCEYILSILQEGDDFEDAWMNRWKEVCNSAYYTLTSLEELGRLTYPEEFIIKKSIGVANKTHSRLPLIEQYSRFINSQLGLDWYHELTVWYTLKECLK